MAKTQTPSDVIVEYRPEEHGFFEDLVRLAICLGSVGKGFELHKNKTVKPFRTQDTITIEGKKDVSGLEVHFFPRPLYDRMLSQAIKEPEFLRVIKRPINPSPPKHQIFLPNVQVLMTRLVGDAFVSYYERHLDAVEARWGREAQGKWPMVWWFAWAIRNACSHNGKIFIKGRDHPAVHWRNLKYDFNDNERTVLFDDLTGVELILLMEEMDAELRQPPQVQPKQSSTQV